MNQKINNTNLPIAWVEKIFRKLNARYGRAFLSQYDGVPIDDVMADWSEELAGLQNRPDAIAHAIGCLPERPPTVSVFRQMCINAPRAAVALPAPVADPGRVKSELARAMQTRAPHDIWHDWIRRGLADLNAGLRKTPTVERMIREAAANARIAA